MRSREKLLEEERRLQSATLENTLPVHTEILLDIRELLIKRISMKEEIIICECGFKSDNTREMINHIEDPRNTCRKFVKNTIHEKEKKDE